MAYGTMEKIQTVTVGAGGQAAIEFLNIPSTYNDLLIKLSVRSDEAGGTAQSTGLNMSINGVTTNRTFRTLIGYQGTLTATTTGTTGAIGTIPGASVTASTFNNFDVYIPGYAGGLNKAFLVDAVTENASGTNNELRFTTGLWSQTTAISSLSFSSAAGNIVQHSTATLYGIARTTVKATGGMITEDANYIYHTFRASGTFTTNQAFSCDILAIGGGGGSSGGVNGINYGSGAASGVLRSSNSVSLGSGVQFTVTVGAGGAGAIGTGAGGASSVFSGTGVTTITATAGNGVGTGRTGSSNADYSGGTGVNGFEGGGGAGSAGNGSGPNGGAANSSFSTWLSTVSAGVNGAIGGGGGSQNGTTTGGGGTFASGNGTANTGGGGGGGSSAVAGGNGGSGIVIVRYAK